MDCSFEIRLSLSPLLFRSLAKRAVKRRDPSARVHLCSARDMKSKDARSETWRVTRRSRPRAQKERCSSKREVLSQSEDDVSKIHKKKNTRELTSQLLTRIMAYFATHIRLVLRAKRSAVFMWLCAREEFEFKNAAYCYI